MKQCGADTVKVRKLFNNNFDSYIKKYQIISNAEQTFPGVSISVFNENTERAVASQAADELININDIKASFVVFNEHDKDVAISARSYGKLNVQVVLEKLGGGGSLTLAGGTSTTDAKCGAGGFSYGDGKVTVSDTTITTKQDTSGGIHVAGGGTLTASNLTVETNGESSAAIRSDRCGGTMTVDGSTYTSRGTGSPAVYCTADITVNNAALTAENSEAVCIEGLNSLSLTSCPLSGNIPENEQNDCDWTVSLYQSLSGDSEVGESKVSMDGGSLTSLNGGLFYTTNTESSFYLKDVDITYSQSNDFFLKCTGNANKRGWGQSGNNGADCTFPAESQEMSGDIIWDSISTLVFTMKTGSSLTGAIVNDETKAGNGGEGSANVTIDKTSNWTVTSDSRVSKLVCSGTIVDNQGKNVTIKKSDGTVIKKGSSCYTITVDSCSAS